MTLRRWADLTSRLVGAVIFVVGAILLILTPVRAPDTSRSTSTEKTVTQEVTAQSSPSAKAESHGSKSSNSTVTKEVPKDLGLVKEAFTNRTGIILIRLGLAALAAFIAAAFVQRLILARFALKISATGIELEPVELQDASEIVEGRVTELEEHAIKADAAFRELVRRLEDG